MTKRELNKLPAGTLTTGMLYGLGLKELVNVALHCFTKWKTEQFMCAYYKKEVKEWNAVHQKTLAANKEFFEDNNRLEAECTNLAASKWHWYKQADYYKVAYDSLLVIYHDSEEENDRLQAENQRLKQQLAARTVSTDFYPGQFITYYPN